MLRPPSRFFATEEHHFVRAHLVFLLASLSLLGGCGGNSTTPPPAQVHLTVTVAGTGTVTSTPAGINCPGTCSASFASGTSVSLSASAGSGFTFSGFTGACSGSSCALVLSSDQSVSATFTASSANQLTVSVTGSGTVTSNPAGINCPTT